MSGSSSGGGSQRRRKSLSGITEGKQSLIGVIDTSVGVDGDLDELAFARSSTGSGSGNVSKKKGGSSDDGRQLRRRHSYQGVDMQLILQNSGNEGGASPSLRRVNSLGDQDTKLARRGSKGDLLLSRSSSNTTPVSTPRVKGTTPSLSRNTSVESVGSSASDSNDREMDIETKCVKHAQKAIKRMPGRSIQSIKNNPKYSMMGDASSKRGISLITKHIALGGRDDANDIKKLKGHGISHVLNVAAQMPNFFEGEFVYLKIPLQDTDDASVCDIMPQAHEFMRNVESVDGRVLVHCISGVSRSTTVVLMYLMQAHQMQLLPAYNYVHSCRPFIEPNKGFRLQLAEEELLQHRQSTVADKGAGSAWDFYEWNRKKEKVKIINANQRTKKPHDASRGGRGDDRDHTDGCLECIVRMFI